MSEDIKEKECVNEMIYRVLYKWGYKEKECLSEVKYRVLYKWGY